MTNQIHLNHIPSSGAGDVKVKAESISGLATSVANGILEDKETDLKKKLKNVQSDIRNN